MAFDLMPLPLLDTASTARGDLLARSATAWQRLPKGVNGQVLAASTDDTTWAWRGWVQRASGSYALRQTVQSVIPGDDTKPQQSEGVEIVTASITPKHAGHLLRVTAYMPLIQTGTSNPVTGVGMLFRDAAADAVAVGISNFPGLHNQHFILHHEEAAGGTAATTFKLRWGTVENYPMYINGHGSSRLFGGALRVLLLIDEFAP